MNTDTDINSKLDALLLLHTNIKNILDEEIEKNKDLTNRVQVLENKENVREYIPNVEDVLDWDKN